MSANMFLRKTAVVLSVVLCVGTAAFAQPAYDQARDYYRTGNLLYQQGRFREAQEQYQKALDLLKDREGLPRTKPQAPVPEQAAPALPERQVRDKKQLEYTIGDEDVLKISVWQNADLDQEVIVRPDGMISFPLIGDVEARGLTIRQLTLELTRRLSEYVRAPQVSILLKKMGGSKVIVLGEVDKPGVYAVTGARTALEAVGLAGGFTNHAVPSSTVLIRDAFINPKAQKLNLSRALAGKDILTQNVMLKPEDIIFVPKKSIANLNYFLEQFLGPVYQGTFIHRELEDW